MTLNIESLFSISYGMYLIGAFMNGKSNAQIANAVFQITAEPPMIAISINKKNLTHDFIKASNSFCVSALAESAPMEFIGRFGFRSGRDLDKFDGVNFDIGQTKSPIVKDYTVSYFEANVKRSVDCGTHTIFIGEVTAGDKLSSERPMTYVYYRETKNGSSPESAPTYVKTKNIQHKEENEKMKKYKCKVCGYVYNPEKGDESHGIKAGTTFENLPDDWKCPVCGVDKDKFEQE